MPIPAGRAASRSWARPQSSSSGPTAISPLVLVSAVRPVAAPSASASSRPARRRSPSSTRVAGAGRPGGGDQVGLGAGRLERHHRRGREQERGEQLGPPAAAELGGDPGGGQQATDPGRPLHQVVQGVPAGEQAQVQQQVLGSGRDGHLPVDGGGPEVQAALGHPVLHLRQVVGLRVEVVRLGQQRDHQLERHQPEHRADEQPLAACRRTPGVEPASGAAAPDGARTARVRRAPVGAASPGGSSAAGRRSRSGFPPSGPTVAPTSTARRSRRRRSGAVRVAVAPPAGDHRHPGDEEQPGQGEGGQGERVTAPSSSTSARRRRRSAGRPGRRRGVAGRPPRRPGAAATESTTSATTGAATSIEPAADMAGSKHHPSCCASRDDASPDGRRRYRRSTCQARLVPDVLPPPWRFS